MLPYYAVTGFGKRFRNIEDAEVFRLDQIKKTGRTDLRVRKVRTVAPGQQTLLVCNEGRTPSASSHPFSGSESVQGQTPGSSREGVIRRIIKRLILA